MSSSTPISLSGRRPYSFFLVALVPVTLILSLVAILMGASPWLPLALALALTGLLVVAADPARLAYLIPLLLAVEYRIRASVGSVTVAELSVVLIGILLCLRMVSGQTAGWPSYRRDCTLIGLVAVATLPSMWFLDNLRQAVSSYRDLLLPLFFYLGFRAANLDRRQILGLVRWFVVLASAAAVLGIVQYTTGQFLFLQSEDDALWQSYKVGGARSSLLGGWLGLNDTLALGFYSGVNNFATYLLIPCCVALAWGLSPAMKRKERLFWLTCAGLLIFGLLFTFFRTGYLALAMMALVIVWFRKRPLSLRSAIVAAVAVLAMLAVALGTDLLAWDQFATVQGRSSMILDALDLIARHPLALLTGGYNELYYADYYQIQAIHNVGLYMLVRFGMLSALALLAFYWGCLKSNYRAVNVLSGSDRDLALGLFAGVGVILIFLAQTTSFLDSVQNSMWLAFWLAAASYLRQPATARAASRVA
jgi:hypothetical protein